MSPEVKPRLCKSTDHWCIQGHGGTQGIRTHTCVASGVNPQPGSEKQDWVQVHSFPICLALRNNFLMPRSKELWSRWNKVLNPENVQTEVYRQVLILLEDSVPQVSHSTSNSHLENGVCAPQHIQSPGLHSLQYFHEKEPNASDFYLFFQIYLNLTAHPSFWSKSLFKGGC